MSSIPSMSPNDSLPTLEDPVRRLVGLLSTGTPRVLVALAGLPGSGKSTLATHLSEAVNRHSGAGTMVALGMDGFHLTKEELRHFPDPEAAFRRRGAPWTFDVPALEQRLQDVRLNAGKQSVWWPDFQHEKGDPVEAVLEIPPSVRLVLVEGLYLSYKDERWSEVYGQFEEHWFLDTPLQTALERLTDRHRAAWGLTREEAQQRIAVNDQLNAKIVASTRANAQWRVLDGTQ